MRIIFARHGQTVFGKEDRLEGCVDSALTALGLRQAKRLALFCRENNIVQIYTSPLTRSLTTAKIVGRSLKIKPLIEERIREVCYGEWEGVKREQLKKNPLWQKRKKNLFNFTPPEGESYKKQYDRCMPFFQELTESKSNILVVAHKGVMRCAAMFFAKLSPEEFNELNYGNDEIVIIDYNITS